jgi:GNAT superfamily N-acetyltransferase
MESVQIRCATHEDVPLVTRFIRSMVEEMATLGGHAVSTVEASWTVMAQGVTDDLAHPEHGYFLAEQGGASPTPLGMVAAHIRTLAGAFAPTQTLHISAVYVVPTARRQGLAQRLLHTAFAWGRHSGCVEADLNVLVHNPARTVYERLGFTAFEFHMVRSLAKE